MSDDYTSDEIVWRESVIVYGECVSYVVQLGFKSGYGGVLTLQADKWGDKWYAIIEAHRKFSYGPSVTADQAKLDAIKLAKQVIVEMASELKALEKNTKLRQISEAKRG